MCTLKNIFFFLLYEIHCHPSCVGIFLKPKYHTFRNHFFSAIMQNHIIVNIYYCCTCRFCPLFTTFSNKETLRNILTVPMSSMNGFSKVVNFYFPVLCIQRGRHNYNKTRKLLCRCACSSSCQHECHSVFFRGPSSPNLVICLARLLHSGEPSH